MIAMEASVQHYKQRQANQGTPGQAATGSTQRAGTSTPAHYSAEAVTAMTLLGLVGIGGVVVFLLVCAALVKRITGGKQHGKGVANADSPRIQTM